MPMTVDSESVRDATQQGVEMARWHCHAGHDLWIRPTDGQGPESGRFAYLNPKRGPRPKAAAHCAECGEPIEPGRVATARTCLPCRHLRTGSRPSDRRGT